METRVKWIISGIVALAIISYFIYASIKPLEAELLEVKLQTVSQSFKEEGIVKSAVERPVYSVTGGKIEKVAVSEGQAINKGDLLFEIEGKDLEYQLRQLQAQLESIKGQEKQANKNPYTAQLTQQQLMIAETERQLEIANQDYNRIKTLYDSGAVSKKQVEDADNRVKQLENSLEQQKQALQLIEEQADPLPGTDQYFTGLQQSVKEQIEHLEYLIHNKKIVSPIDTIVKEVPVKEGAVVTTQTPLLILSADGEFEVDVYLLTEDVLSVEEGMPVTLIQERKDGDYRFGGVVKAIAPAAEERISALGLSEQKIKVTITPNQKEAPSLRPGYALDVEFVTLEQPNKIAVPKVVLFPYGEGDALWVVKDGKVILQEVKTGMETDELIVIENGLAEGDVVLKNPQLEGVKEGKRVEMK